MNIKNYDLFMSSNNKYFVEDSADLTPETIERVKEGVAAASDRAVRDIIKEVLQVDVNDVLVTFVDVSLCLLYRLLGVAIRPEAIAVWPEL